MIIDQLPLLAGDAQATDELAIERGTTTYKASVSQIAPAPGTEVPIMDGTGAVGVSAKYAREDHVHPADTSKQAEITANGMLKGTGAAVSAATKGTDYGAMSFQITLLAANWSSNAQTISNANFLASGYLYIAEPVQASKEDYGTAKVYALDVSTNGQITFNCTTEPTTDLTVNIARIVSSDNKTINVSGGGSGGTGSDWELLWTNPNPLTGVSEQSYQLDLSGYTEIKISIIRNKVNTIAECIFLPSSHFQLADLMMVTQSAIFGIIDASNTIYRRFISNVSFTGFTIAAAYGSGTPPQSDYLIPYQIFGR